jgi:outer membrane protein OmpA-like peptidoglycan-associated protein
LLNIENESITMTQPTLDHAPRHPARQSGRAQQSAQHSAQHAADPATYLAADPATHRAADLAAHRASHHGHPRTLLACAMLLLAGMLNGPVAAQVDPASARTDGAVHADLQTYHSMQARIKAQNDAGVRVADYDLAKAQCWLDVSLHEYTRNDRSLFPVEALNEAAKIVKALEAKNPPGPSAPTVLVNHAARLREDLWSRFASLKQHQGYRCATQQIACAEVELVHAGNEYQQQGWRHANPYIQIAEDLSLAAQSAAEACPPPDTVKPPPPAVPCQPCNPPALPELFNLAADALFKFDKYADADLLPEGRARIDEMMTKLNLVFQRIDSITLIGHTDRLGSVAYNQTLSERRAATIKRYIQSKGYPGHISTEGKGKTVQIKACDNITPKSALTECLQPNRRVEIEVRGIKR